MLAQRTAEEDDTGLMKLKISPSQGRAGNLSCVHGGTDADSLKMIYRALGLAKTEAPALPGFDEARQCPGDLELDNLILGKKRSDSLLSERAELARTWLAKHVCRPIACGTSRRAFSRRCASRKHMLCMRRWVASRLGASTRQSTSD